MAFRTQALTMRRRAAVLHDGGVERFARRAVPHNRRFALIGNPIAAGVVPVSAKACLHTATVVAQISSGSCSTHPSAGKC